jgi:thiol:disulfide interchange protein
MMFIVMGVGMAFPYVILTANPKWIDRIPKSGPGSELVKQVMGILLIAAAWFFLANVPLTMQSSSPSSQTAATTPMTTTTTTTREPETSPTERS